MSSGLQTAHSSVIGDALTAGTQPFVDQSAKLTATLTTGTPATGYFHSSIIGRAQIPNIAADLRASLGIERVIIPQITQLTTEFGANGEPVYSAANDDRGLVRFVGNWSVLLPSSAPYLFSGTNGTDYCEVTFYGTGLNIVSGNDDGSRDARATVNGGTEGANFMPASISTVPGARSYTENKPINVATGLTLGVHTVKIRNVNWLRIYGFEILNTTSASLTINPGVGYLNGQKYVNSALDSVAYKPAGMTLGKGGRVVQYLKEDGTIGSAYTEVPSSPSTLTNANHTNEEVVRTFNWREFGAGRADDFSTMSGTTATDRAFTLDDGTAMLVGYQVNIASATGQISLASNGSFITVTFVGTGLDLVVQDGASGGNDSYTYSVDGATPAAWTNTAGNTTKRAQKIVSGLPYGTHTFKLARVTAATWSPTIHQFIIYQSKKPTLPAAALEVADYNVLGDYVANTVAGLDTIGTGLLRKSCSRELIYVNGTGGDAWAITNVTPATMIGGLQAYTSGLNSYAQYTFFGTGFDARFTTSTNRSSNIAVTVDTLALTVANFSGLVTSVYGGAAFSAGVLNQNSSVQNGAGFSAKGLPLGWHTVKFNQATTAGASTYLALETLDIITPIHATKTIPGLTPYQANVPVGSCSLTDSRKTTSVPLASANAPGLIDFNAQDIYGPKKFMGMLNPSVGVVGKTSAAAPGHIGEILTFTTRTVSGGSGSWVANTSALTTLTQGNWLIFGIAEWDPTNAANGRLVRLSTNGTNDSSGEIVTFGNAAAGNAAASTNGIHHFTGHYEAAYSTPIYGKAYGEDAAFTCAVYGFAIRCS